MKIAIFLPWCIVVGAAILLAPKSLELVTFGPGYVKSPRGLRRFVHWAECALHHVGAFLFCTVFFLWTVGSSKAAVAVVIVLLSGVGRAWGGFQIDANLPLGEEDRQSIWLVARNACGGGWGVDGMVVKSANGCLAKVHVCEAESGCFVTDTPL